LKEGERERGRGGEGERVLRILTAKPKGQATILGEDAPIKDQGGSRLNPKP